jgi:hypothetical protein
VLLEHFTTPAMSALDFSSNTNPLALRIIKADSDRIDLYILSGGNVTVGESSDRDKYAVHSTGNTSTGADLVEVHVDKRYNPLNKSLEVVSAFTTANVPKKVICGVLVNGIILTMCILIKLENYLKLLV